jgi:hypothetical protein
MTSFEAMKKAVGGKTKLISDACKEGGWTLEPPTLYQYQEPYGGTFSGAPNCIDRTNRIVNASKKIGNPYESWSAPLHCLCHEHNHIAVRLPDRNADLKDIQQSLIKCIKEFSDLASASSEAMEKNSISKQKASGIIAEGEEALQQISAYLQGIKALHAGR